MNHASLFSGIGGFDLAAKWIGWDNIFQVEKDPWCQGILAKHFPDTERYLDIKEFSGEKYAGSIDIISGGFPCQPFSVAGKQKGKNDDRYLWPEMLRVIREIQPTWIVGENVPGIISMALDQVCTDLENEGYTVQAFIIPAASVNAIHKRDRVWILAYSESRRRERREEIDNSSLRKGQICANVQKDRDEIWSRPIDSHTSSSNSESNRYGRRTSDEHRANRREASQKESLSGIDREEILQSRESSGTDSNATDTDSRRIRRHERESIQERSTTRGSASQNGGYRRLRFPLSQPTICRGDDGLSYRLDDGQLITAKQRTNALKGLGNSVVPQVVYEIFRMIGKIK